MTGTLLALFIYPNFYNQRDNGWHFYEDPKQKPSKQPKTVTDMKKKAQQLLNRAVWAPTPKNILEYLAVQKIIMKKSQEFSNQWHKVLIEHPEFDHTLESPVSYYGALDKRRMQEVHNAAMLKKISKSCDIVLIADESRESELLQQIALDLADYRGFKLSVLHIKKYPDLLKSWQVQRVPVLILVDRSSDYRTVITYGLLGADAIEKRIVEIKKNFISSQG